MQDDYTTASQLNDQYSLAAMNDPALFQMSQTQMAGTSYVQSRHPSLMIATSPSGHSRRRSPENLIPLDAPTQPRTYITPSATSRKEVPSYARRRTPYGISDEDEEDELTEEPPAANATDQEKIEYKRRQNTLAARRSRKRKAVHIKQLQDSVDRLSRERDMWKARAITIRQLLVVHGVAYPEFTD